ncbi:MAG: uroporphyrinogen decarboxylase family protein [Betaproteobacteria bacterium]
MNPLERVCRRLRGEPVDRRPNFDIYMQRAARHVGRPLSRYYLDHRALVEANLAVLEAFSLDLVQAISDPYREASDLGLAVEWPDDAVPLRRALLLPDPDDAARLRVVAPEDGPRMSDRLDAVRLLRERVGDQVPVMGWVEGAFALASVLRGDTNVLLDLHDRPEWLKELLERLVELGIAFARAQVAAGARLIGLGDSMGSLVSPRQYREFVLPYEQRVFSAVREAGAIPRLHICGDTGHLLADMARSGAAIVDLDWMVDLGEAARAFGPDGPAPCGNFDPVAVMLQGTPETVASAVRACAGGGGPRHFSAAGCEVPDRTPDANPLAHARVLRELG